MNGPLNPIAAATHSDPYPYYAALVATQPLYYDAMLGMWVASSAEIVTAILQNPDCRVRPRNEPVPKALLGSPAADIFRQLVRMNDGANHCPFKRAVSATLGAVEPTQARHQGQRWAQKLADMYSLHGTPDRITDFAFDLPVYVMGSVLGMPEHILHQTARWISDFVGCLAPTSNADQIARGKAAAGHLYTTFHALLVAQQSNAAGGLLGTLAHAAGEIGNADTATIVANGIGLLSQSYEATAGLIGNTLVHLAAHADLRRDVIAEPALLRNVIQEVVRYDPPIQNTRRFLAEDVHIAGHDLHAGDTVLVVLAAANRDPCAHSRPDQFDPWRNKRRSFTFGLGAHACPGDALAALIAEAGVACVLAHNDMLTRLNTQVIYRPSANARIPMLTHTH